MRNALDPRFLWQLEDCFGQVVGRSARNRHADKLRLEALRTLHVLVEFLVDDVRHFRDFLADRGALVAGVTGALVDEGDLPFRAREADKIRPERRG